MREGDRNELLSGMRDSFPVFLGYLAVSFTLGITARKAGLTVLQASLMSLFNTTSAGQASAIEIISAGGSYIELAVSQFVINLRYLLMGAVLSSAVAEKTGVRKRLAAGFGLTDEIFALSSVRKPLNPLYPLGGWFMAMPGWVLGTYLGVSVNQVVPGSVLNALSMGLYAMFTAIIVPPAVKSAGVRAVVAVSVLAASVLYYAVPEISPGMRVVVLTVVVSAAAALIRPVDAGSEDRV